MFQKIRTWLPALAAFIWPFAYFYKFIIPLAGQFSGIGNDFDTVYYPSKPYLLDWLVHIRIPLWSPSEAAGYPFYSSPIAQVFYPLNLVLAIFYRFAGGFTILDYQVYTILGVAIFALGLFFWLKTFGLNWRAVLFAVLCFSVSFKIAETTRFANSIQEAAWYPWILYALTCIFRATSKKTEWLYGLLLFFFMYCLFTAGYPYFIYYSLFLIGPYLLFLLIPGFRKRLWGIETRVKLKPILISFSASAGALLLCLPYLMKMQELLQQTAQRGGGTINYATANQFTLVNSIGSLIFPPSSQVEGWYFFGILTLLLILLYLVGLFSANKEGSVDRLDLLINDKWLKIFFGIWILFISLITYGNQTFIFTLLWKVLPFFQQLRNWPRLNIVLIPILAWMGAIAYAGFEKYISKQLDRNTPVKKLQWRSEFTLLALYLIILGAQIYLFTNKVFDESWSNFFLKWLPPQANIFVIWSGAAAFLLLETILIVSALLPFKDARILSILFICFGLFSGMEKQVLGNGIWQNIQAFVPREEFNIHIQDVVALGTVRKSTCFEISLSSSFCTGLEPNWHYNRYRSFVSSTKSDKVSAGILMGQVDGNRLFFTQKIDYSEVKPFLADAAQYPAFNNVVSYNGDDLLLDVKAPGDGYVSFIDNWDSDWKAEVDGKTVPIELLFGTFKSVHVSAGEHQVLFSYRPSVFWQINNLLLNLRTKLHFK
jgi:hypothetical protein